MDSFEMDLKADTKLCANRGETVHKEVGGKDVSG